MSKIPVAEENGTLVIDLPEELDTDFANQMISESKSWLLKSVPLFVYNFRRVKNLKISSYRAFVITARMAKQGEKQVASINMQPDIYKAIKQDGVLEAFNPMANATSASASSSVERSASIDVTLINPFIEAIVKTLKVQAQTESKPGKPYLLKVTEKEYSPPIGIVGLINLNSSKFAGTIALAFNEKVFLQLYENMFGEKHEKITTELQDAAAEILNIIYGTAKSQLNQIPGFDLQPVIPTVLAGEKLNIRQNTREKIIILPFESAAGSFQMEIAVETKK